jgi:hypothetical protein
MLSPSPSWSAAPAWDQSGQELTLVDIAGGQLLRYSGTGLFLGSVARPGQGSLEFTRPTRLLGTDRDYLLIDRASRLLFLDSRFVPQWSRNLRSEVTGSDSVTISDAAWLNTGRDLIALGQTSKAGEWWEGFLRLSLLPIPSVEERVQEVPSGSLSNLLYRLTLPVLAAAAGEVYALSYTDPPALIRLSHGKRVLRAFPSEFRGLPQISEGPGGARESSRLYHELERSAYAVSLYGRGDHLFLLTRAPAAAQATTWALTQIDPRRDEVIRTITLPTAANHLDVAPGPRQWALVEKGRVVHSGKQQIGSIVLLPTAWVEDASDRRWRRGEPLVCR